MKAESLRQDTFTLYVIMFVKCLIVSMSSEILRMLRYQFAKLSDVSAFTNTDVLDDEQDD